MSAANQTTATGATPADAMAAGHMIEVRDLVKTFGKLRALDGITFTAERGTVLGLLGPNGAGKSTVVRIPTTLLRPDSGVARLAGLVVVADAQRLRSLIGLTGQAAAVDELLTGRENLELMGLWYHFPKSEDRRRAQETLELLSLTDAADRSAKTYSGGMRRHLDHRRQAADREPWCRARRARSPAPAGGGVAGAVAEPSRLLGRRRCLARCGRAGRLARGAPGPLAGLQRRSPQAGGACGRPG